MVTQVVNARIDSDLKKEVDVILKQIGLTSGEAIRLFYTQIRNTQSIPFQLTARTEPNEQTKLAMKQALEGKDLIGPFDSIKDALSFLDEVDNEED